MKTKTYDPAHRDKSNTASGQIRTDDRRFTNSKPDVPPNDTE